MPYIAPYRSQLRPYNHAYAYRGLTAFATLSMAVSESKYHNDNHYHSQQLFLYWVWSFLSTMLSNGDQCPFNTVIPIASTGEA
ncbi:MAG: hypothetical protein ABW170_13430 [Candidatus Thiodiazotropha sp. L084R]